MKDAGSWKDKSSAKDFLGHCLVTSSVFAHQRLTMILFLSFFSKRSREPETDRIITTFEEHEDSVYIVEWSTADPWIFASLSYDGRIVINRVPRAEKYKILL